MKQDDYKKVFLFSVGSLPLLDLLIPTKALIASARSKLVSAFNNISAFCRLSIPSVCNISITLSPPATFCRIKCSIFVCCSHPKNLFIQNKGKCPVILLIFSSSSGPIPTAVSVGTPSNSVKPASRISAHGISFFLAASYNAINSSSVST